MTRRLLLAFLAITPACDLAAIHGAEAIDASTCPTHGCRPENPRHVERPASAR